MFVNLITRLKSSIFYAIIYLYPWFYMLFMWVPRRKSLSESQVRKMWVNVFKTILKVCSIFKIHYKIEGEEHLEEALNRHGCIWASKHQSVWDTIYLQSITDNLSVILKYNLLKIPVFGDALANSSVLGIKRDQGLSAIRDVLKFSRKKLAEGRQILIFPEGKRMPYGERTEEYQIGIAAMYEKCNAPVLPIALDSGKCWGRYSSKMYSGTINVKFLPIIEPGLARAEFIKKLNTVIEDACAEMYATD